MEQIEAERTLTCLQALIERYSEIPDLTTRVSDQIEFLMKAQRHVVSQMTTFEAVAGVQKPLDFSFTPPSFLAPAAEKPAAEKPAAEKPAAEKPWYPDDSGEWVECAPGQMPLELVGNEAVIWLLDHERSNRQLHEVSPVGARMLSWLHIVAYKVVKP